MTSDVDTEEAQVSQLKKGDEEAWRQFLDRYVPRMMAYALRHVKSRSIAEDIVEDSLSRTVSAIRTFRYEGIPLDVWVYKIERNALSDYYRKRTGYAVLPFQEFMDVHSTGLLSDPCELVEAADTRKIIEEAIDQLEEPKRSVTRMRLLQGKSVREVSFLLNLGESNVKILLFRALSEIRARVTEKMGGNDET